MPALRKKKIHKNKRYLFYEAFVKTLIEFTQVSTIHGLKFTTDIHTQNIWRIMWVITIFILFICANKLVATFYGDFLDNPTRVNIETDQAKLPFLKFPAVSICGIQILSYVVVQDFVNTLKLPKNVTNTTAIKTIYQSIGMDMKVKFNETLLYDLQELVEANRYSIPEFIANVRQKCEDFFIKCRWRMQIIPCYRLFIPAKTFFGQCCSFNIKQDGLPFRNAPAIESGIAGGLSIMMAPLEDENSITKDLYEGFKIIIHKHDVFPSERYDPLAIGVGYESFISLRPVEITCSDQVKQLSVNDRGCVFPNEKPLQYFPEYDTGNCIMECMINNVVENCDCSPYFFGVAGNHQICNFTKVPCLVENYDINFAPEGSPFFKCQCLPNCVNVNYEVSISQVPLLKMEESIEPFYQDLKGADNTTIVHIYMGSQKFTRFRRDLLGNLINLIANFGSAYSLFMGISTISVLEMIYYFTFVLRRNYLEHINCHNKVTAFLRIIEKPILKNVKYDKELPVPVIEMNTLDAAQFDTIKEDNNAKDDLKLEDLVENEFGFALEKKSAAEIKAKMKENLTNMEEDTFVYQH